MNTIESEVGEITVSLRTAGDGSTSLVIRTHGIVDDEAFGEAVEVFASTLNADNYAAYETACERGDAPVCTMNNGEGRIGLCDGDT